jgi:hypothetical protein
MTTTMHQRLCLAVLYNFMVFTAQSFRRVLGSKPSCAANLKMIRDLMIENLSTMDATFDNDLSSLIITQFKAVVLEIEPFGLATVVYIRRQISKNGITMSETKINSVIDFPKPLNYKNLRPFLGLANYFRDSTSNHSNVVNPSDKIIDYSASKQAKPILTEAGEIAFRDIKSLISKRSTLYFISDTTPIVLMKDASNYGVEGYLYQLIDLYQQENLSLWLAKEVTLVKMISNSKGSLCYLLSLYSIR